MDAKSFMNLVNEKEGFEFVIGYKDFIDHRIGGQGNKYWYLIDYCSDIEFTTTHTQVLDTYNDSKGKKLHINKGCQHLN